MTTDYCRMPIAEHINEAKLELFIIGSKDIAADRDSIENHLAACPGCRELYDEMASFYAEVDKDFSASENLPVVKPHELTADRRSKLQREYWEYLTQKQSNLPFPYQIARWIMKHPYIAGGTVMVFSALVIGALLSSLQPDSLKPKDMNPTNLECSGEMIFIKNIRGENIDEIFIGKEMVSWYSGNTKQPYDFYDVDKDGINELFWTHGIPDEQGNPGQFASAMSCMSFTNDKILWSESLIIHIDYPAKNEDYKSNFVIWNIKAGDFDKDGNAEVIVHANHNAMFPSAICKLNPSDGKINAIYSHSGQISRMNLVDINNDGITEILATAINNSFSNASIIVLDPRLLDGHSPSTPSYRPSGFSPANEIAYIRIPRTVIGENLTTHAKWNSPGFLEIYKDLRSFRVDIADASSESPTPSLQFIFKFDLSVETIRFGDYYEIIGQELFKKGVIKINPDAEYLDKFKQKIMYWDGYQWENHPVYNKHYLNEIKKVQ